MDLTQTQRLALGRLDHLKRSEIPTRLGIITRRDVEQDEELAREVLRATFPRAEEAPRNAPAELRRLIQGALVRLELLAEASQTLGDEPLEIAAELESGEEN